MHFFLPYSHIQMFIKLGTVGYLLLVAYIRARFIMFQLSTRRRDPVGVPLLRPEPHLVPLLRHRLRAQDPPHPRLARRYPPRAGACHRRRAGRGSALLFSGIHH